MSNMVYEASVIIGKPSALVRSEFESHYYRHRYMAMPVLTGLSRDLNLSIRAWPYNDADNNEIQIQNEPEHWAYR